MAFVILFGMIFSTTADTQHSTSLAITHRWILQSYWIAKSSTSNISKEPGGILPVDPSP